MNKNRFPFFCDNRKTLSNLELNWKGRLIIVIMRFKNWGILLGWYSCISPSFCWGIFGHMLCLNWLHRSKNIWWIICGYKCQIILDKCLNFLWTANQLRDFSMNQVFTPQMSKFVEWRCPPSIFTVLWARRGIFITMSFSIQRKFSIKIVEISSINKELIV